MKKWWIVALVFVLLLATLIAWGLRQSHAITVVTHGGFEVYDVRYFPGTNRIFYWRAAWRNALGLVGLQQRLRLPHGPALVVYSSYPPQGVPIMPSLWNSGGGNAYSASAESFGSNRLVTVFFFDHGPMTNGTYQLAFPNTNVAELTVNFKN